jgi:hypothetical protein
MARDVGEFSEFDGGGVMPNTVYPKGTEALTPADKLRLDSITGQDQDSRAPVDPWHWQGGTYSPSELAGVEADRRAREANNSRLRREASQLYTESPY